MFDLSRYKIKNPFWRRPSINIRYFIQVTWYQPFCVGVLKMANKCHGQNYIHAILFNGNLSFRVQIQSLSFITNYGSTHYFPFPLSIALSTPSLSLKSLFDFPIFIHFEEANARMPWAKCSNSWIHALLRPFF